MATASLNNEQKAQRSRAVEDLVQSHAGWDYVHEKVQDMLAQKLEVVSRGKLSHDEYLRDCGYIQALKEVLAVPGRIVSAGSFYREGQE